MSPVPFLMKFYIKVNGLIFHISPSLFNALKKSNLRFKFTTFGKNIIVFISNFSDIFLSTSVKNQHFIIISFKKYRITNQLFKALNLSKTITNDINLFDKTFIEVCSGAGGFSRGFVERGFKPILLNDNNKQCVQTLKNNFLTSHIHFYK